MADPLQLSVVIVAKNEAANLPRCLASVRGWTAEIVVVLNATTDASEALALAAGARVHHLPWSGFRDTKNAALALATQPWALCLDADEEVSPALRAAITEFFVRADFDAFAGARFPRKVWFIDRWITHGDWYPDLSLRLICRARARWGGDAFVHEKMECTGPVATLRGDLHHYSFPTLSSHVAKINPFADLFLRRVVEQRERLLHRLSRSKRRSGWGGPASGPSCNVDDSGNLGEVCLENLPKRTLMKRRRRMVKRDYRPPTNLPRLAMDLTDLLTRKEPCEREPPQSNDHQGIDRVDLVRQK